MGVTRLDGRILGNDRPGPLTRRLHDAYWQFRKQRWAPNRLIIRWPRLRNSGGAAVTRPPTGPPSRRPARSIPAATGRPRRRTTHAASSARFFTPSTNVSMSIASA